VLDAIAATQPPAVRAQVITASEQRIGSRETRERCQGMEFPRFQLKHD
jgi:hypothetical protein